jgi:MFS family permease
MTSAPSAIPALDTQKAPWSDLFRDGRSLYSVLVILGTMLNALQVLVMAIIMPTVVADIGGAEYYTWTAMLYTVGTIVGAAAVAPVWSILGGARPGYALSGVAFLAGTLGCALAPSMGWLNAARLVQGLAGGLVMGGSMSLIGSLFPALLRTRILAIQQGTFTASHLLGPVVGGLFAQFGWWRGSFWSMVPLLALFALLAWMKLPERVGIDAVRTRMRFPFLRLSLLSAAVFCVAAIGPVPGTALRIGLAIAALLLLWSVFRLDRRLPDKLYPSNPLSVNRTVGLTLWILLFMGLVQTSLSIFLPLLLQVVHGVRPLFVSFVNITLSFAWTVGTFSVAGWSGARERFALAVGPLLMLLGLAGVVASTRTPDLVLLTGATFVFGLGIGLHNVHLVSRAMAAALKGEERITASALSSIRSVGTAFGAALMGGLASMAGLGNATEPAAVAGALSFVFSFNLAPLALAALATFWLLHINRRSRRPRGA